MTSPDKKSCRRCLKKFPVEDFINEKGTERGRCNSCRLRTRTPIEEKQLCEECGKRSSHNFPDQVRGIRCKTHMMPGMVNVHGPEFTEKPFREKIKLLGGEVFGEWKGSSFRMEYRCKEGHDTKILPASVIKGKGCTICKKSEFDKSKKKFFQIVADQGGKVVGEYKSLRTRVDCLCSNFHPCSPLPSSINAGGTNICRICSGQRCPETYKQAFIEEVAKQGGKIIGKYLGSEKKVEILCSKGHTVSPRPHTVMNGHGICVKCVGHSPEEAKKKFFDKVADLGGKVLGEYVNSATRVNCSCPKGHAREIVPADIVNGGGALCRDCNKSRGETMIYEACKILDIPLVYQASHQLIPTLRFDYSCVIEGSICYIEFDGEQHFHFISKFFSTEKAFQASRQRDLMKMDVCKMNDIKLVRLDYTWNKKSVNELAEYLKKVLYNSRQLVADSPLYKEWEKTPLLEETLYKYVKQAEE